MPGRRRLARASTCPRVLRPAAHAVGLLTIAAGVALADGIQAATGLQPQLKWPNDVYVGGRKLAGILAEAGTSSAGVQHVVLGFGINVMPAAYPPDVAARATSLESELGRPIDRGLLLAECLAALAPALPRSPVAARARAVIDAWRGRAVVDVRPPRGMGRAGVTRHGVAEDIDETGALLVRDGAARARVISGEVRWLS